MESIIVYFRSLEVSLMRESLGYISKSFSLKVGAWSVQKNICVLSYMIPEVSPMPVI